MINTTDHAVRKMTNLVDHIRKPSSGDEEESSVLDLTSLVTNLLDHYDRQHPIPKLEGQVPKIMVKADPEQLRNVLGHLIQNAIRCHTAPRRGHSVS